MRATRQQTRELLGWAEQFPARRWAVESANGHGYLLAQQLVAAGEHVVDVPSTLAARARVLDSTRSQKNDPNDARSVAIVALRQGGLRRVTAEDHVAVLRMLGKRHKQLASMKTQAASRLHTVLATLIPGGLGKEMVARQASDLLRRVRPQTMVETERKRIAHQHLGEVRRLEKELKASRARLETAVQASGTRLTDIYGVGPIVAGLLIGYTGDITRFPTRHHYAAYNGTAPIEASSGQKKRHRLNPRGNRMLNHALHLIAITQLRYPHTEGRAFYQRKLEEGKTKKEAIRSLKRRISDVVYRHLVLGIWCSALSRTATWGIVRVQHHGGLMRVLTVSCFRTRGVQVGESPAFLSFKDSGLAKGGQLRDGQAHRSGGSRPGDLAPGQSR